MNSRIQMNPHLPQKLWDWNISLVLTFLPDFLVRSFLVWENEYFVATCLYIQFSNAFGPIYEFVSVFVLSFHYHVYSYLYLYMTTSPVYGCSVARFKGALYLYLYRVFFLTGAPPKNSKYKKVTLG